MMMYSIAFRDMFYMFFVYGVLNTTSLTKKELQNLSIALSLFKAQAFVCTEVIYSKVD